MKAFITTDQERLQLLVNTAGYIEPHHVLLLRDFVFKLEQDTFAGLLGVSKSTISRWELGRARIPNMAKRAIWLLATAVYEEHYPEHCWPYSFWDYFELGAQNAPYFRQHPRAKPPKLPRDKVYYTSLSYVQNLHYTRHAHQSGALEFLSFISQNKLAHLLGANQATVNQWYRGKQTPNLLATKLLFLLAAAPIAFDESWRFKQAFEWMYEADYARQNNQHITQPTWFKHYELEPITHGFDPNKRNPSTRRLQNPDLVEHLNDKYNLALSPPTSHHQNPFKRNP